MLKGKYEVFVWAISFGIHREFEKSDMGWYLKERRGEVVDWLFIQRYFFCHQTERLLLHNFFLKRNKCVADSDAVFYGGGSLLGLSTVTIIKWVGFLVAYANMHKRGFCEFNRLLPKLPIHPRAGFRFSRGRAGFKLSRGLDLMWFAPSARN